MVHSVLWGDSFGVIVPQHVVQKVNGFFGHQRLVLVIHELVPRFLRVLAKDVVIVRIQSDVVLLNI